MIREARGLMLHSDNASIKRWRDLNEVIWNYWANDFPAYVKQDTIAGASMPWWYGARMTSH
eukprot:9396979-Pyramimonas_sp.AAC.1